MKSERRHELETNELSKRLDRLSERVGPHSTTIVTVALVAVACVVLAMYLQKAWAARSQQAWDVYHLAVESNSPDLEMLKQSAEEHAGSPMAEWSNITWADGHVYRATRLYIHNRATANDDMNKAEAAYQALVAKSKNPAIRERAHLGLARIYEMRNDLKKAREHYDAVSGAFQEIAQQRIEALEKDPVVEAIDWLASAEPPPRSQPDGPGTPGVKPDFEVDDLLMSEDEEVEGPALGDMLERFGRAGEETDNRYPTEPATENQESPVGGENETASGDEPEAGGDEESDEAVVDENSSDGGAANEAVPPTEQ
jgi:prepilin-type processing-associated H-X9-DG protein